MTMHTKLQRATLRLFAAIVCIASATSLAAQDSAQAGEIAALREQIRLLDQKIRVLEQRQAQQENQTAAVAPKSTDAAAPGTETKSAPPSPTLSLDSKGFVITSPEKDFSLKIGALVQADARVYLDDGAPNRDTFLLRRVRTPINGTVWKQFDFNITPEFASADKNDTNTQLVDAWIRLNLDPAFGLRAGKYTLPVIMEPGANRHFNESPFTGTLSPVRDIGIEAYGQFSEGLVSYRLGVFNGAPNNNSTNNGNLDDGDFSTAGRLTLAPFKRQKDSLFNNLNIGLGAAHGNERGTSSKNGLTNIKSNGQQDILEWGALYANGHHTRLAPGLEWFGDSPFSVSAEFIWERQALGNGSTFNKTITNTAWALSAGYVLTGEKAAKSGVTPKLPFNLENGTWGAFELTGRVSGIDMDNDLFTQNGGPLDSDKNIKGAIAYGLGLNWYLNSNFRLLFNIEYTDYDGAKTSGAAKGAQDDELYFFARFQASF